MFDITKGGRKRAEGAEELREKTPWINLGN